MPLVLTGFSNADCNLHEPNENAMGWWTPPHGITYAAAIYAKFVGNGMIAT